MVWQAVPVSMGIIDVDKDSRSNMKTNLRARAAVLAAAAIAACTAFSLASAHEETGAEAQMHMHHHMMRDVKTSSVAYNVPPIMLVRADGRSTDLKHELDDGRAVVLAFIYTTCTTICPVISQTLEQLQDKLGPQIGNVHLVSISIDPETDTPARLRDYAAKFNAGPEWQYYTGTVDASIAAQKAFNVYREDKMDHNPVVLLRAAPGKPWLRVDGFATADELLHSYRELIASN
jgi:protein SCO1/2